MYEMGVINDTSAGDITTNVTSLQHNALARQLAVESLVLLQNDDNTLPLKAQSVCFVQVLAHPPTPNSK